VFVSADVKRRVFVSSVREQMRVCVSRRKNTRGRVSSPQNGACSYQQSAKQRVFVSADVNRRVFGSEDVSADTFKPGAHLGQNNQTCARAPTDGGGYRAKTLEWNLLDITCTRIKAI